MNLFPVLTPGLRYISRTVQLECQHLKYQKLGLNWCTIIYLCSRELTLLLKEQNNKGTLKRFKD